MKNYSIAQKYIEFSSKMHKNNSRGWVPNKQNYSKGNPKQYTRNSIFMNNQNKNVYQSNNLLNNYYNVHNVININNKNVLQPFIFFYLPMNPNILPNQFVVHNQQGGIENQGYSRYIFLFIVRSFHELFSKFSFRIILIVTGQYS